MKIKWGSLVVDGRNKIGGHVASKNRFGAYIRTKVTPSNPRTPAQITERNRLASLSSAFRSLTAEQIAAWNDAAKLYAKTDIFGDLRVNTGLQLFVALNANLLQIGATVNDNPPAATNAEVVFVQDLFVSRTQNKIQLTLSDDTPSTSVMIVKATPALSPGINFVKTELRKIGVVLANSPTPVDITAMYMEKFGAIGKAGQKVFVEVYFIDTLSGVASVPQKISTIITA
jgi:hypothetical protein